MNGKNEYEPILKIVSKIPIKIKFQILDLKKWA